MCRSWRCRSVGSGESATTSARNWDLRGVGSSAGRRRRAVLVPRGILPRQQGAAPRTPSTKWQTDMDLAHGKAEVIIGKQRHGPTGTVELHFEGSVTRFGDLAPDNNLPDRM